jgi:TadE-like protein
MRRFRKIRLAWERYVNDSGSQIAEFAVSLPLLVVFAVGIFDFGAAFTLRQKLASAAQEHAIVASNESTRDLDNASPQSIIDIRDSIFDYLAGQRVLPRANTGSCKAASAAAGHGGGSLIWTYTISGCPDTLVITIDRGNIVVEPSTTEKVVSTQVTVTYPHRWQFSKVIRFLAPGAVYAGTTTLTGEATSPNQL